MSALVIDLGVVRSAFEHWYSDEWKYPQAVERSGAEYKLMNTQLSWTAWKASWSACAHYQNNSCISTTDKG